MKLRRALVISAWGLLVTAGISWTGLAVASGLASSGMRNSLDPRVASGSTATGTNTGDVTIAAVGSADAKGATISGQAIALGPADATHPGIVTNGTQTLGSGAKTVDTGFTIGTAATGAFTVGGQTCTGTAASNIITCGGIFSAGQVTSTDYVTSVHLTGTYIRLAPSTLDTCAIGTTRIIQDDATGSTGGRQTKQCKCIVKNDGTTYAWIQPLNTVASGHRYGTTTTCPDVDE
jgi:hypothetical protein